MYIEAVKDAIRRNGILMARIPAHFETEVSQYGGGDDPLNILRFRAETFPDLSSWKPLDCLVTAVFIRLYSHIQQASSSLRTSQQFNIHQTNIENRRMNVFGDLLYCIIKRFDQTFAEISVINFTSNLTFRIRITLTSSN